MQRLLSKSSATPGGTKNINTACIKYRWKFHLPLIAG